jgi:hypothetical protein
MSETTPDREPEGTPVRRGRAWPYLIALTTVGMLLSVLPHLINAARSSGDPAYIADGDGLLYLAWSREVVLDGGWSMTDAVHRPSGPMMHPWILFVPAARLAHSLGLGMTGLGIVWRLLAGASLALALYAAVRPFTTTARGAAGLSAFLLFDAGFLSGQLGLRDIQIVVALLNRSGRFIGTVPEIMPHLRAPTPALALPFLLVHYALTFRARRLGTTGAAVAAGVSFGVLFHVYFYFATAVGLGTVLAWFLDRRSRRTYGIMLAVAVVVAAPAIALQASIKASTPPDWLVRTDKFAPVDRLDRNRLQFPRILFGEFVAAAWFIFRRRPDLIYLWTCTGAALVLVNQHVITGFDIENFHWWQALGTTFSLLLALLVLPWVARVPGWRRIAVCLVAGQVALGFWLRTVETTHSAETNDYRVMLANWRSQELELPPRAVVAGPPNLLLLLAGVEDVDPLDGRLVEFSSAATDKERDERYVLNLVLMGVPRSEALATIKELKESRDHVSDASRTYRLQLLAKIGDDPIPWIKRFKVSQVLIPSGPGGRTPPAGARLVKTGKTWTLWRLEPNSVGLGSG